MTMGNENLLCSQNPGLAGKHGQSSKTTAKSSLVFNTEDSAGQTCTFLHIPLFYLDNVISISDLEFV